MSCRSIILVICMFVAVSLANLHRDPNSTEEWSTTESVREVGQESAGQLGALLDAGDGAVVTLEAGGARLAAHRAVLAARCPALADMSDHFFANDSGGSITVPDVDGAALRHLLAYLYTLRAPRLPPAAAAQLLATAHRFGLPALQADCERQVATQLTLENAAAAAVLAVNLSANHLRDAAVDFIMDHRIKVLATQGWADALQNRPEEAAEVSRLLADRLPGICGPATMEAEDSTVQAQPSPAPATAPTPLAACPTSPLDEDAVSRLRNLSKEEKDFRLDQAAERGAVGDLRELLAAGADVRARRGYYTALHKAAVLGHPEAASCLLEAGSELQSRGPFGFTPLQYAAYWGRVAMVRLLLAASADPNARSDNGDTPLHGAALDGRLEVAALLMEAGADPKAKNNDGKTPLNYAWAKGHQQLIEILTRD